MWLAPVFSRKNSNHPRPQYTEEKYIFEDNKRFTCTVERARERDHHRRSFPRISLLLFIVVPHYTFMFMSKCKGESCGVKASRVKAKWRQDSREVHEGLEGGGGCEKRGQQRLMFDPGHFCRIAVYRFVLSGNDSLSRALASSFSSFSKIFLQGLSWFN